MHYAFPLPDARDPRPRTAIVRALSRNGKKERCVKRQVTVCLSDSGLMHEDLNG
jgi:hypothetical protein